MSMVRMFHMSCDKCGTEIDHDEWYAEQAKQAAKDEGYRVRGNDAICPECWDAGERF